MSTKVLSVGGSIIVPEKPDTDFLSKFVCFSDDYLNSIKPADILAPTLFQFAACFTVCLFF